VAQSLNTQTGRPVPKRPSSKTPSIPLTSKTGTSKNINFGSANVPSTASGAAALNGTVAESASSDE